MLKAQINFWLTKLLPFIKQKNFSKWKINTILKWANSCRNILTLSYLLHLTIILNLLQMFICIIQDIKTQQYALPKARSNSGAKMIKYSAMEIWSTIPSWIKHIWHFLGRVYEICITWLLETYYVKVDWFNYLTLLQWKLSNHEVSLTYITSFGFCCIHKNLVRSSRVWSIVMCLVYRCKANYMPIELQWISVPMHTLTVNSFPQCMIARLVLNLLKSCDTISAAPVYNY